MDPRIKRHNNFIYLTVALVLLLLTPALGRILHTGLGEIALKVVAMGTLTVAFTSVSFASRWGRTVIVLLFLWITAAIAQSSLPNVDLDLIELTILLTFFSGEAYYAAKLGLDSKYRGMDANLVASSISLYLLLGLIWTMVFLITLEFFPDSFNISVSGHWPEYFHTIIYFTYVTMTSLGYGDISPTHSLSQIFAVFTAISGTFYVAIVVATIVGVRNNPKNPQGEDLS
ncbi:MAG: potassium channel family protein [Halioglobus sp.]